MRSGIGSLVLLLLAGSARAQPAPQPLSILDVPFISQSEALCGGAAAAMILRYWGQRGLDAESFSRLVDRSAAGIRTTRLVDDLRERGWNVAALEGTGDRIDTELARLRPVLTLIEDRPKTFHYIVIVASTGQAVVFHDPARAPFRVMSREQFNRRWEAAGRWMAIVVPGAARTESPPPVVTAGGRDGCATLVARGVQQAQSNELDAAERTLTAALSCGGSAPLREMAGLRLLQRRWPEVGEMATAALEADPGDAHAWELLATSRFVQADPSGALEAWNRIGQPRVDLVAVGGLTRTRQRAVERLLDVPTQALLTPRLFGLAERRLSELPSASTTRLEFVPMASGLAELRAHVVERPLVPSDAPTYLAVGLLAASRREVSVATGSFTGGGERVSVNYRFWPDRPQVKVAIEAPAPWGGVWGVEAFGERQPFTGDQIPAAHRTGAAIELSNWVSPWARVSVRAGVDSWDHRGTLGFASGSFLLASTGDRVVVRVDGSRWSGASPFASTAIAGRVRSAKKHEGRVYIGDAGAAVASRLTPPDVWFAGDTGQARSMLLRAHPLVDDGAFRTDRIGRHIVHASGEVRQWWGASSLLPVGGALFVDAARVGGGGVPGDRADVDAGVGIRIALPVLSGVLRLDVAKGLRDGATGWSFVYEP